MVKAEKLDSVSGRHLPALILRHTRCLRVKHLDRFRPARHHVGKIRRPHHPIHTDLMPQLYSDVVLEKSPLSMLFKVFAGQKLELWQAELALGPKAIDRILVVYLFIEVG